MSVLRGHKVRQRPPRIATLELPQAWSVPATMSAEEADRDLRVSLCQNVTMRILKQLNKPRLKESYVYLGCESLEALLLKNSSQVDW